MKSKKTTTWILISGFLFIFIAIASIGAKTFIIKEDAENHTFIYKKILVQNPEDECDPNQDPDCEIIIEDDNPCNQKYDQCIEKCNDNEKCMEKCDLEYDACLNSLEN